VGALAAEGLRASTRGRDMAPDWHLARFMFPVTMAPSPAGSADAAGAAGPRTKGKPSVVATDCPVAEQLFAREVTVHLDQWWSDADCDAVAEGMNKALGAHCPVGPMERAWVHPPQSTTLRTIAGAVRRMLAEDR
jgi:hypothetical protein